METTGGSGWRDPGRVALVACLLTVLLATVVRVRLLDAPLDRDTGEYAYAGQLLLEGVPPYGQINNMKMPGIYAAFAASMGLFGETRSAIHLGLLLVNAATALLLFLLARRFFDLFGAASAAACFSLLSLGQPVRGTVAKAEHFVIFFAVAGVLLLLRALDTRNRLRLLLAGLLFGAAFLMKQHGAAFAVFAVAYLSWHGLWRQRRSFVETSTDLAFLLTGVLLPLVLTCAALWSAGVFDKFWFWTVSYGWEYVSAETLSVGLQRFGATLGPIVASSIALWLLSGIGAATIAGTKFRERGPFLLGLLVASLLATAPGLYFRPHYFILLLPAAALLAGASAEFLSREFSQQRSRVLRAVPLGVVIAALALSVYQQRRFFFEMSPEMATRSSYAGNPFVESLEISRFIEENSAPDDRIAILGSEPQIYFYSKRRSATGYIYAYPLMELQPYALRMQQEMIAEIEAVQPKFVVRVRIPISWLTRSQSERTILRWAERYLAENYRQVGVVELAAWNRAIYHWDHEAAEYAPRFPNSIHVFERVDAPL